MTFDGENPNSLLSLVSKARENARGIRENISAEMWEALNTLYWSIRGDDAGRLDSRSRRTIYYYRAGDDGVDAVSGPDRPDAGARSALVFFAQAAKYLERIDVTCRVIEMKYTILQSIGGQMETAPPANIQWMAVLSASCCFDRYAANRVAGIILGPRWDPLRVTTFLILEAQLSAQRALFARQGARGDRQYTHRNRDAVDRPRRANFGKIERPPARIRRAVGDPEGWDPGRTRRRSRRR